MRLVYDLRYATDHFPGVGTHAHALLQAWLARPGDDHFTVLWGAGERSTRLDLDWLARHERVTWTPVHAPSLGVRAPFETGAVLRRVRGDAYLSPFYLRPVGAPMPVVLTVYDANYLAPGTGASWRARMLFALALRHARGVAAAITPSEFSRRELIRYTGFPADRLHVVPLGAPAGSPLPAVRPAAAPERPFALVVGTNRPHKNLRTLVHAWRLLGETGALALLGAGPVDPRYPSLGELARELGTAGTHTLGAVSPPELDWLYEHATLLVFPSRYEGFGFPLLEAAARGVPVLASDIPALRELGAGVARFVAPGDAAAWAAAVRELAADAPARARMSADGRALAARYDYAAVAASTRDIVASVVGHAAT